jgi:hypothetical protein
MTLMDESVWRGKTYSVGGDPGTGREAPVIEPASASASASGAGARSGGAANLEAFTDTRRVTVRGDIAPYPF